MSVKSREFAGILLGLALGLSLSTAGYAQNSGRNLEIISSVVIQATGAGSHYIYPAGVPILTDAQNDFYSFRIEQYFSFPIDPLSIKPYVHSNWILDVGQGFDGRLHQEVARHLRMARPICEEVNTLYRCYIDLELVDPLPEGNLGITLSYLINGKEVFPLESSFTFMVLSEGRHQDGVVERKSKADVLLPETTTSSSLLSPKTLAKSLKAVGQVSLEGRTPLGSGFVIGDIERILPVFDRENILGKGFYPSAKKSYIVTAAHLFPNLYLPVQSKLIGGRNFVFSDDDSALVYYFSPSINSMAAGKIRLHLVAASLEADLALLEADSQSVTGFLGEYKLSSLPALNLAPSFNEDTRYLVLGFPSKEKGKLSALIGGLTDHSWNSRESSNFSPLPKIKLKSITEDFIGSSGLSGGPVINAKGEVIGVTLEKADFGTSVLAINLVAIQSGALATPISHLDCRIFFNPYERTLTLVNNKPATCNNESIGFGAQAKLKGIWQFQEVLGFSKQGSMQKGYFLDTLSEQSIIHGHVIIFDKAIVDGTDILKSKPGGFVLDPALWDSMGSDGDMGIAGYQFNPSNFRPLDIKGIRVTTEGEGSVFAAGSIVTAYRDSVDSTFTAVNSLRDFIEWLNLHNQSADFAKLICFDYQYCY